MREVSGVSAKILEEAVAGLAAVEAGEANLDDFLDFRLQYLELRRSISNLLFLCFRRKRFLEGWIGRLAARPPRPAVRRLLTAVLAQITFQTGIAPESAVNIAVGLVKHSGKLQEAKFVNAVLRRALEQPRPVPEAPELVLPPVLFKRWRKRYSEAELAQLAAALDTPIATGEMLTSFREHEQLILGNASDFVQPDAPRVGGISPFLKIMDLAAKHGRKLAPHFAMEVHLHLAAAYPLEPWLEHFEWLNPLFNEQLELRDGRMWVSERHGLGFTLSEQARRWTQQSCEFGTRP